jgi:2-phosphoglycerate kinase
MKDPLIIIVGGAAGTAKTSNGKIICNELNISHRLGSGFMREAAKSFVSIDNNPYLYNYSFSPHDNSPPFENLYNQSKVINNSMELCIDRAFREGTSLLIEGVNVIPGLINTKHVTLSVIFTVNNFDQHYEMITGKSHFKRKISKSQFTKVREIQDCFEEKAKSNKWPIIDLSGYINIINNIKELI